MNKSFKVYMEL